jgi:phosphoribosylanthranilate isomerase
MALKCLVKVNAINNLSDARYCAGMGVDLLGYRLDPGVEDAMDLNNFREINEWVAGIQTVGEYGNAEAATIMRTDALFHTDYIEYSRPELTHDLKSMNRPLILTLYLDDLNDSDLNSTLEYCSGTVDYYVLTSERPMTQEEITKAIIQIPPQYPIILGTGIDKNNIQSLLSTLPIRGVALSGSDEIRPGYKDYDRLADILEVLEEDQ